MLATPVPVPPGRAPMLESSPAAAPTQSAAPPFIRRHPVATYFALVFAISIGGMLPVFGASGISIPATPAQFERLMPFAIPLMLLGPPIAGILLTGLVAGGAGLRDLRSRLLRWRVGARWYAVALLTAPLLYALLLSALSLVWPEFVPASSRPATADPCC
jgi:uncharacterized protein